jgi:hypothetical protein
MSFLYVAVTLHYSCYLVAYSLLLFYELGLQGLGFLKLQSSRSYVSVSFYYFFFHGARQLTKTHVSRAILSVHTMRVYFKSFTVVERRAGTHVA